MKEEGRPPAAAAVRSVVAAALALAALSLAGSAAEKTPAPDPIQQRLPRDAIPAIRNPRFVAADRATIRQDEKVLGIVIGNDARAYPLIDLDRHEIVDDTVGGKPVAASW